MKFIQTAIPEVVIIEPKVFGDSRGYFFESYNQQWFEAAIGKIDWLQDNESKSVHGVLRGLHFQRQPYAQTKLVRCILGKVLDVAVDIRRNSPTFGHHVAIELSADNKRQLFIPKGFAHGFSVLSKQAEVLYKCDEFYNKGSEGGINFNDPALSIDWFVPVEEAVVSEKDMELPVMSECLNTFTFS